MSLETKIDCIKTNINKVKTALNAYLDTIYNMTDKYFNTTIDEKTGKAIRTLKKDLTPDEKVEKFVIELNNDATKYEEIRAKILKNDFELSAVEVARIGIAISFVGMSIANQISQYDRISKDLKKMLDILMEGTENQNVDFSDK